MRKKSLSLRRNFTSVYMYLDDIEHIVTIMEEQGQRVKIESDGYIYDTIEDLVSNHPKKTCDKLSIEASNPYVSVEIERGVYKSTYVYMGGAAEKDTGTHLRLCEVLKRRVRFTSKIFSSYLGWVVFVIFCLSSNITKIAPAKWVVPAIMAFCCLVLPLTTYYGTNMSTRVLLIKRSEISSVFARKKDEIVLLIVGAILGAVVSTFFSKIL